jgi:hypothetical protein
LSTIELEKLYKSPIKDLEFKVWNRFVADTSVDLLFESGIIHLGKIPNLAEIIGQTQQPGMLLVQKRQYLEPTCPRL